MRGSQYLLLMLIQPFWALCIYVAMIIRKIPTCFDISITTFIIAILGIYWYPWGDSQTHFAIYYADIVERFYVFSIFNSNYLYDYILTGIAKISGNYVWGYFCWIFFPLLVFNLSIWKYAQKYKPYTIIFLCLFLFLGCREMLDLNRNTVAALLMSTALLNVDKKVICFILLCFSSLIHSTVMIILLGGILYYFLLKKISKRTTIYILVFYVLFSFISPMVISLFVSDKIINMYIEGNAGVGITVPSGFFYLMTIVNILLSIFFGIVIISSYNNIPHKILYCCYLSSCCITLGTWFLWTMRERFLLINLILGFSVIMLNWNQLRVTKIFNKFFVLRITLVLSIVRLCFVLMVEYSSEYIHKTGSLNPSKTLSIVAVPYYMPTSFLLNIDEFGFSDYYYQKLFLRSQTVIEAHKY